jgi:hypothetical protein
MMYRILSKVYLAAFIFTIGWITGVVNAGQVIKAGKVPGVEYRRTLRPKSRSERLQELHDLMRDPGSSTLGTRIR